MASSRDLSNGGAETGKRMLVMLKRIADVTADSPERINRLLSGNQQLFHQAQGGAPLSDAQLQNIANITTALHLSGAQGRDPSTMGMLKNAFKSTGDPATDIQKAKLLGVYDGPMTWKKRIEIQEREERGFTDKRNVDAFAKIYKDPTADKDQLLWMARSFAPGKDMAGVRGLLNNIIPSLFKMDLDWKETGIDTSGYQGTMGATVKGRRSTREELQHAAGEPISKELGKWEDKAYAGAGKILKVGLGSGEDSDRPESKHGLWGTKPITGTWDIMGRISNLMAEYIGPLVEQLKTLNANMDRENRGKTVPQQADQPPIATSPKPSKE
jgi:hypothetical protein